MQPGLPAPLQPDVRPISIGEQDLRAILGHLVVEASPAVGAYLAPVQVSCGIPGGISVVIFGMRLMLDGWSSILTG